MNTRLYNKLVKREDKAKLLAKLVKYTNGCLSKKQLEKIVNDKDTNAHAYIKVLKDAKEFAEEMTLKDNKMEHSWAGEEYTKEEAKCIIGCIEFGYDYSYLYSNNGNTEQDDYETKEPQFDIYKMCVVVKSRHDFSNYNNNYYDDYKDTIIVYIPDENPYKVEESIQYILDNYDIED